MWRNVSSCKTTEKVIKWHRKHFNMYFIKQTDDTKTKLYIIQRTKHKFGKEKYKCIVCLVCHGYVQSHLLPYFTACGSTYIFTGICTLSNDRKRSSWLLTVASTLSICCSQVQHSQLKMNNRKSYTFLET